MDFAGYQDVRGGIYTLSILWLVFDISAVVCAVLMFVAV